MFSLVYCQHGRLRSRPTTAEDKWQNKKKTREMKSLMLLLLLCHVAFAVKHQLRYFLTASSGTPDLPEFMAFSMFDDVQWGYCDSNGRIEPKQEWIKKILQDNPQHLEYYAQECERYRYLYRAQIDHLKQQLNQSEGVHIFQRMHGCEWDDETGEVGGFNHFGYDGEDFISFDPKALTWVAARPQAVITKHKWDEDSFYIKVKNIFNSHLCPDRLKKYMEYLKSFVKQPARPSVSLLQRTPSSPVSCHATGFYPDSGVMSWRKDGQEMDEDVQHWEILPNPDGTFQMTVELEISSIKPEDWRRYECVFHLSGVKEEIVTRLDRASIRTNWVSPSEFPAAAAAVVGGVTGLLLLALFITGLFIWKRKKNGFKPANTSEPSSSETCSDAVSN